MKEKSSSSFIQQPSAYDTILSGGSKPEVNGATSQQALAEDNISMDPAKAVTSQSNALLASADLPALSASNIEGPSLVEISSNSEPSVQTGGSEVLRGRLPATELGPNAAGAPNAPPSLADSTLSTSSVASPGISARAQTTTPSSQGTEKGATPALQPTLSKFGFSPITTKAIQARPIVRMPNRTSARDKTVEHTDRSTVPLTTDAVSLSIPSLPRNNHAVSIAQQPPRISSTSARNHGSTDTPKCDDFSTPASSRTQPHSETCSTVIPDTSAVAPHDDLAVRSSKTVHFSDLPGVPVGSNSEQSHVSESAGVQKASASLGNGQSHVQASPMAEGSGHKSPSVSRAPLHPSRRSAGSSPTMRSSHAKSTGTKSIRTRTLMLGKCSLDIVLQYLRIRSLKSVFIAEYQL